MSALDGIRVADLTSGPAGGLATTVLADFGADVIKIEPPHGDRFRALAGSPLWLRGKRSCVVDLRDDADRSDLERVLAACDVVVVGGPPARARRLGLDADAIEARHPGRVHCALTAWGPRGPLADAPGYEALVAARAGRMQVFARQARREGPAWAALPVSLHLAAMGAVQGIAAALYARERGGGAQRVETSLLQALLPFDLVELLLVQLAERGGGTLPDPSFGVMPTLNYHPVQAADGRWIQCGNLLEHLFYAFLDAIDLLGELLVEERFQDSPATWDPDTIEAARDRILLRVRERPAAHWMEAFAKNGNVAAEPFASTAEALAHPDLLANGNVVTISDPEHGEVRTIGPIARLTATPGQAGADVPAIGEHTAEVFALEPRAPRSAAKSGHRATPGGRPLAGLTVVDFSTIIAAPLGTTFLADLGARVIKVEATGGDPYRHLLPRGMLAVKTNAGKESLALDLKSDAGRAIVRDLVGRADVIVHNFRSGVAERLGIGEADCRALAPDCIWVAVHGYGPDGPGATRPATHPVVGAAMGGAGYQAGHALHRECPDLPSLRETARQLMRANEANPDPNTSGVLAAAVCLALVARERGAGGQRVDVSMIVANAWANADDFLSYAGKPPRPALDADLLGVGPGARLYPTREGWVCLVCTTDAEWARLAELSGDPALVEPEARTAERLEALLATRSAEDWEALLLPAGVGCVRADRASPGPVWCRDEQVRANGFAVPTPHARFGEMLRWGPLVTVGGPAPAYGPGALSGDHSDALLAELGIASDRIAELRAAGVVASEEP